MFCVQAKWDEREDETLTAIGVEVDAIRRSKNVIKSSTGGASAVPTIQVAGLFQSAGIYIMRYHGPLSR